jgi:hypothetical protein
MAVPSHIQLVTPWQHLAENRAEEVSLELKRELSSAHVLYGIEARAIAGRIDRDDILFELSGFEKQLAVVHLTWSQKSEQDSKYPMTKLFAEWDDWVREKLLPDHEDYGE